MVDIQDFSPKRSQYERPTQNWMCGHADNCSVGPDKKGRCRAAAKCKPSYEDGQWVCCRKDCMGWDELCSEGPMLNGSCAHQELCCVPVRGLRARRGLMARWMLALSIGLLATLITTDMNKELLSKVTMNIISPGTLSPPHAAFTKNCSDCHQISHQGVDEWVNAAIHRREAVDDNSLCLKCHQLGEHTDLAHGYAPKQLAELTQKQLKKVATDKPKKPRAWTFDDKKTLACAVCHHEHQDGRNALIDSTTHECQACHTNQFHAFADDHPEFNAAYPHSVTVRQAEKTIRYSHLTDKHKSEDCQLCHKLDGNGVTMWPKTFFAACDNCHKKIWRSAELSDLPQIKLENKNKKNFKKKNFKKLKKLCGRECEAEKVAKCRADEVKACATLATTACAEDDAECITAQVEQCAKKKSKACDDVAKDNRIVFHADGLLRRWYEVVLQPEKKKECNTASQFIDFVYNYTETPDDSGVCVCDKSDASCKPSKQPKCQLYKKPENTPAAAVCLSCHISDAGYLPVANCSQEKRDFSWEVKRPEPQQQAFTRFAHQPHISYLNTSEKGCKACHELTEEDAETAPFDFLPIKREVCAQCHTAKAKIDSCITCHSYHITSVGMKMEKEEEEEK